MIALVFEMVGEAGKQKCVVERVEDRGLYLLPPGTQAIVVRFGETGGWRVIPARRTGVGWEVVGETVLVEGTAGEDVSLNGPFPGVDALWFAREVERG